MGAPVEHCREPGESPQRHTSQRRVGGKPCVAIRASREKFHQEYDYAQHGDKTGKNVRLIDELGLTDYLLERFAVAGAPSDIVRRIRSLASLGLNNLWLSSPGDDPSSLDLMGQEVLPHLNP